MTMSDDTRLEPVLTAVSPEKRDTLRKIIAGAAFAVPTVASFAVADLAFAQVGSGVSVTTLTTTLITATISETVTAITTTTVTATVTTTVITVT
jgi:hypothetical protein